MLQWLLYASWKKHDIPICNSVFPKTLFKTTQVKAACALLPGNILLRGLTMSVVICIAYPMYLLLLLCLGDFNEKNNKSLWMSKSKAGVALTWLWASFFPLALQACSSSMGMPLCDRRGTTSCWISIFSCSSRNSTSRNWVVLTMEH